MPTNPPDGPTPRQRRELLAKTKAKGAAIIDRTSAVGRQAAATLSRSVGTRLAEQLTDWPTKVEKQVGLSGEQPVEYGDVPETGDVVLYIHGFLGEGRLDGASMSGAHQAAALEHALADEFTAQQTAAPTVIAGMWNSSTTWPRAKRRAKTAGETLTRWLETSADRYDSVTILGHSLGARVTLTALNELETTTVDSVGLLGAAVNPDTICHEFKPGIESGVDRNVYNYYSANDTVVCQFYRVSERSPGLGCAGSGCDGGWLSAAGFLPRNFVDVDVTNQVQAHLGYYKPVDHGDGGSCIREIVSNQLLR